MYLGVNAGANGVYDLSGTGSLSAASEYIGDHGAGSFTQNGGTNTVAGTINVAQLAGSSGTYSLQGGSLSAAQIIVNGGGTFDFEGGRLEVALGISLAGILEVVLLGRLHARERRPLRHPRLRSAAPERRLLDTLHLPALSKGLVWDTSDLYTTGEVTAVPEPSTLGLLALGCLLLAGIRRSVL